MLLILKESPSRKPPGSTLEVDKDDVSKDRAASPLVEAGPVYVPESQPRLADFF